MGLFKGKVKSVKSIQQAEGQLFCLTQKNAWFLWLTLALNISLIAIELAPWMLAIIVLVFIWQALFLFKKKDKQVAINLLKVSPFLLALFALFGCLAIAATAKQLGLLGSMVHLLCFSYAFKTFELKARRDFYQLCLLGLFVLITSLIFRQDLAFSIVTLIILIINLAMLLQFFSHEKAFSLNIKTVSLLIGQSSILAVVLFLVFPRISPFWQMPLAKSAQTGLSDSVKPGDIAKLTRSTKLAFRVDFNQQERPDYSQLYWRAMVLENFDGREWTRLHSRDKLLVNESNNASTNSNFSFDGSQTDISPIDYQVIVEPSFQHYLFALAPATLSDNSVNKGIIALPDHTFKSTGIISQTKPYHLTSYLTAPLTLTLPVQSRQVNLHYPVGSNEKLERLAKELQQKYADEEQRAQAVLSLIRQQNFSYTLEPPLLINNSLDQFFFDTKAGFCVHYASAFTFLMRAAGIPARMVTGYLGGEFNNINSGQQSDKEGHLSVYQYDAHAWSEIWVQGKGWLRIDPTSAVDPQRVNSGWSSQLLQQQSVLNNDLLSLYRLKKVAWLNALRLQFDALDYQWTRWVIGFTAKQQYDLLKNWFGNVVPWKSALIMGLALITSMAVLMLILQLKTRIKLVNQSQAQWLKIYNKALGKLTEQGLEKPIAMTVNDFAKLVREQYPDVAIVFTRLSSSYNGLCYQPLSPQAQKILALKMQQEYQQFVHTLKKQS